MPVEIKVPSVGESVTEGVLSRWLKYDLPESAHAWEESVGGFDERGRLGR
jgi:hypothetical protein